MNPAFDKMGAGIRRFRPQTLHPPWKGEGPEIWLWNLPQAPVPAHTAWLSPAEAERAGRYLRPIDRCRFISGRGLIREVVAARLGADPATIRIAPDPHGRPEVIHQGAPVRIGVSLSHSGGYVAALITPTPDAGIDIEELRPLDDPAALARLVFTPAEQARLARTGPEMRESFYRIWTRKEAILKAMGTGLHTDPARVETEDPPDWEVMDLAPAPGYIGAVAWARGG